MGSIRMLGAADHEDLMPPLAVGAFAALVNCGAYDLVDVRNASFGDAALLIPCRRNVRGFLARVPSLDHVIFGMAAAGCNLLVMLQIALVHARRHNVRQFLERPSLASELVCHSCSREQTRASVPSHRLADRNGERGAVVVIE